MVTCSGGHITELNLSGDTGVMGPVVWLFNGNLTALHTLTAGDRLSIGCSKGKSDDDESNDDGADGNVAEWTCKEGAAPPSPGPSP